jgi:hypothetical protein
MPMIELEQPIGIDAVWKGCGKERRQSPVTTYSPAAPDVANKDNRGWSRLWNVMKKGLLAGDDLR